MINNFINKIVYSFLVMFLFAVNTGFTNEIKPDDLQTQKPAIEDELLKNDKFKNIMPIYATEKAPIVDEIIEPFQQAGQTLILWAQKKGEKISTPIEDELITSSFKKKNTTPFFLKKQKNIIEDTFVKNSIDLKNLTLLKRKNIYDFSKEQIPIELKVIRNVSTKRDLKEGQTVVFKTIKDVIINGKVLPRGTKVTGKVEMVSESDKMGTPFNIVIDNFNIKNPENTNDSINFHGTISKAGANRTIWVYPLYQAGNLVLYVAGFAFVPIHGGHAKLLTNETYTVFYETR